MRFLCSGPESGPVLVLAHGAGAPMDSAFMTSIARFLGEDGVRVTRFEFAYMAARRDDGRRRPPAPKATLVKEFLDVLCEFTSPVIVGGKSLGGRIACEAAASAPRGSVLGIVCLGYPFHPPGQPGKLRGELDTAAPMPTLVIQGENDPFGMRRERLRVPDTCTVHWIDRANHDLTPPKSTGISAEDAWRTAARLIGGFARRLEA